MAHLEFETHAHMSGEQCSKILIQIPEPNEPFCFILFFFFNFQFGSFRALTMPIC